LRKFLYKEPSEIASKRAARFSADAPRSYSLGITVSGPALATFEEVPSAIEFRVVKGLGLGEHGHFDFQMLCNRCLRYHPLLPVASKTSQ
jgi:hypothetical protein